MIACWEKVSFRLAAENRDHRSPDPLVGPVGLLPGYYI